MEWNRSRNCLVKANTRSAVKALHVGRMEARLQGVVVVQPDGWMGDPFPCSIMQTCALAGAPRSIYASLVAFVSVARFMCWAQPNIPTNTEDAGKETS
jgi:hypothetical protein